MKFGKRLIQNEYLVEADPSAKLQQPILQESGSGLTSEPPDKETWPTANEVDLSKYKASELPQSLDCPSALIALYLQESYELTAIPPLFFQRMSLLQVLDLSLTNIKSLPNSLPKLVALKKLLLRGCLLFMELSPQVGELGNLEELDLDETQIMGLPREIGKLLALRHLRVSLYPICGKKKWRWNMLIHPETISYLSQLTDLSIDVDPADKRWDDSVEVVVKELCKSKTLRTLSLYLPKFQLLQYMSLIYPSLSRFRFTVGHIKRRIISRVPQEVEAQFRNPNKCLKFVNGENIPNEIKGVLKYSNSLFLENHGTTMNLSEFGMENMKWLKCCLLAECNTMETIIDGKRHCQGNEDYSVENVVLPSLEYLGIYYMENLRFIWTGPTCYGCLSKLRFLALHSCPQLSNVFSPTLLENLIYLEEFILEDCPLVTSLVSDAIVKPKMTYKFLPSLKKLLLLHLPELISISNGLPIAPKLESIGFYNCPKLKNISKMELSSRTLKIIKGEHRWWEGIKWNKTEWGNWLDYLMRIFSPINNEEDVMTQMAKGGVLFEAKRSKQGQQPDYTEETINGTDLKQLTPWWTSEVQLMGSHHQQQARVPLPSSAANEEPVYVNAKQHLDELSREQDLAEVELLNKLVKKRKPLLHESGHLHTMIELEELQVGFSRTQSRLKTDRAMKHQVDMSSSCGFVSKTTQEDSGSVSEWSIIPGSSNSQLKNHSAFDPIEKLKKPETSASYRLYGVKLIKHSSTAVLDQGNSSLSTTTTSHLYPNHMQREMNSSCGSVSMTQNEGSSLSSADMSVSQHLFPNAIESACGWHIISSGLSNPQLKNDQTFARIEDTKKSETATSYRLFGIELIDNSSSSIQSTPIQLSTMTSGTSEGCGSSQRDISEDPKEKKLQQLVKAPREIQSRQSCSNSERSALVGSVNLGMLKGYEHLTDKLEEMFEIKGELSPRNKWEVVYTNSERDTMPVGDIPWLKFCTMVRRIYISPSQDVEKLRKGSIRL